MKKQIWRKWNLLDWFLILLVILTFSAIYYTFVNPVQFSHLIRREGVSRFAEVEIFLPEDLGWLKETIPAGEESRNVYGDVDWKILRFEEVKLGEKKIVKVTAKLSIVQEGSGILRYGKYTLVMGSKIVLINDRYLVEGRVFNYKLLDEKVLL